MAHHAYFVIGEVEEGIASARAFVETELGLAARENPNVMTLRHGLLSVEDVRKVRELAELAPTNGTRKAIIISAGRVFHEAQNALLKLFEEPPEGTTLVLIIPAEGLLLPTLRSRLLPLPRAQARAVESATPALSPEAQAFLAANDTEREKLIAKLLDRAKSDKDDEKQAARLAAIRLLEGLTISAHGKWETEKQPAKREALRSFLADTDAFLPILHERSAPLKLIFEHLLLTVPL